jgi:hypothetical protein
VVDAEFEEVNPEEDAKDAPEEDSKDAKAEESGDASFEEADQDDGDDKKKAN